MLIKYWPNKITTEIKEILLGNKITTLIWENWSGKSAILESILEKQLIKQDVMVIWYSSWLNESFSKILKPYIDNNKKLTVNWVYDTDDWWKVLNGFYFSKYWGSFIIFLAYSLKNEWRVKKFFQIEKNKYLLNEIEPFIQFNIDIQKTYIEILEKSLWEHKSLITSDFHNMLNKLLNNISLGTLWTLEKKWTKHWWIKDKNVYDFETSKKFTSMILKSEDVKDIFWIDKNKILYYLWLLTNKNYFIDIADVKLYFSNQWMSLNDLSDWEFQLLVIYALLDLFDKEKTLFLFDEIDSHLHYTNIKILWENLEKIKWKIITTTHIPDSIISNDINRLKLVEKWVINEDKTAKSILDRLDSISDKEIYEIRLLRKVKNFILIDDDIDWIIFKKLVLKKLWKDAYNKLSDIISIKKTSSRDKTTEILWKQKLLFVKDFFEINKNIETKNIFIICDRDKWTPKNEIKDNLQVNIHKDFSNINSNKINTKTHLLCWKRLEIENYLLSKELLQVNWCFPHYNYNELKWLDWIEDIAIFDCKHITHPIYKSKWFDEKKLDELINKISKEEISEDIEKMYNFIINNL